MLEWLMFLVEEISVGEAGLQPPIYISSHSTSLANDYQHLSDFLAVGPNLAAFIERAWYLSRHSLPRCLSKAFQ